MIFGFARKSITQFRFKFSFSYHFKVFRKIKNFGGLIKMENSILKITKEDLTDYSIFVNWGGDERIKIFKKINEFYSIKELAKILNHDETTLYQIRTGKVKPSTKLYFSFLDMLKLDSSINSLILSSRNAKSISIKNNHISPELIGLIHSDGHLNLIKSGKGQIFYFSNQHKELIDRFCGLIWSTFECKIYIKENKKLP